MKFFLIAGEPSGDRLGAALMAGLKSLSPGVQFAGVGGPMMQAEGLQSLFPMQELSVMGIAEVLPKYFALKRRISQAAKAALDYGPAALITIDSPDFCLRVAALVKRARPTLRTMHYVAPSVWAWRPGRALKMGRVINHVLALLPFEPPYMIAAGMSCDFVGHPAVAEPLASRAASRALRLGTGPVILALPGSRRAEVTRLAPVFGDVLAGVKKSHPGAQVLLPTVPAVVDLVRQMTANWPIAPMIIEDAAGKAAAFGAADVALAASGTVSLELAANGVPMVIAYNLHPVSILLMQWLALTDTASLVNLVSQTRVVKEYLGWGCKAHLILPTLLELIDQTDSTERLGQITAMQMTMLRLGQGGEAPGLRAARSVLAHLG